MSITQLPDELLEEIYSNCPGKIALLGKCSWYNCIPAHLDFSEDQLECVKKGYAHMDTLRCKHQDNPYETNKWNQKIIEWFSSYQKKLFSSNFVDANNCPPLGFIDEENSNGFTSESITKVRFS